MQGGGCVHQPWRIAAIIEVAGAILHVVDRPCRNFFGQRETGRVVRGEKDERINRLRTTLNIQGKSFVIVVSGSAVGKKEGVFPVRVAACHVCMKATVSRGVFKMQKAV